ncbi:MAG TPA: BrnA antitoxin family protein [Patescibacteria group bacterium]|nr:BrnA antitoxin family protein [Patescibacteria group bacterium]
MKKLKKAPSFKNEDEERVFWATHDTTDYFDHKNPIKFDLSNLKKTSRSVTIRLPESLVNRLKKLAHKKDVPYQSLLKILLDEKVREETGRCANM